MTGDFSSTPCELLSQSGISSSIRHLNRYVHHTSGSLSQASTAPLFDCQESHDKHVFRLFASTMIQTQGIATSWSMYPYLLTYYIAHQACFSLLENDAAKYHNIIIDHSSSDKPSCQSTSQSSVSLISNYIQQWTKWKLAVMHKTYARISHWQQEVLLKLRCWFIRTYTQTINLQYNLRLLYQFGNAKVKIRKLTRCGDPPSAPCDPSAVDQNPEDQDNRKINLATSTSSINQYLIYLYRLYVVYHFYYSISRWRPMAMIPFDVQRTGDAQLDPIHFSGLYTHPNRMETCHGVLNLGKVFQTSLESQE